MAAELRKHMLTKRSKLIQIWKNNEVTIKYLFVSLKSEQLRFVYDKICFD